MDSYIINQLAAWCKSFPTQKKVLFTPTMQIGYNLTTALAETGHSWANLHTNTPYDYALQFANTHFKARGFRQLTDQTAALHMDILLRETFKKEEDHYFSELPITSDLVHTFYQALQEARLADLDPESLTAKDLNPDKTRLLQNLYCAYNTYLSHHKLFDMADVFKVATDLVTPQSNTFYAICDETQLSEWAYRFVQKITGQNLHRIGRPSYGDLTLPPDCAALHFKDVPFPQPAEPVSPGGHLLEADGVSSKDQDKIQLYRAIGTENEVRGILRQILHEKLPLDTVEIAYTVSYPYLTMLVDASETLDIPIAFAGGIPIHLTRPGQALLGFYSWISSHFALADLLSLCRSELLTFQDVLEEGAYLDPHHAAAILQQSPITHQRHAYKKGFDRLEEDLKSRKAEAEREGYQPGRLDTEQDLLLQTRNVIDLLLELVPSEPTTITEMIEKGCHFLDTFAPARTERDTTAKKALEGILKSLNTDPAPKTEAVHLAQIIKASLALQTIETSVAQSGHLYVVSLNQAGYTHRPNLFILGMDESSFPGGISEDPILLDHEREILAPTLPLRRYRPAKNVWNLIRTLGSATGTVRLIASTFNLSDGRETYPSAIFQQAQSQLLGEDDILPNLRSIPEAHQSLDDVEYLLSQRNKKDLEPLITNTYPWLLEGQTALNARQSSTFTRFDGLLGFDTPEHNVANGKTLLSASRLETLAACPYRYFLRYVLHIIPPDDPAADPFRWLTPLEFGSLLHDVFYKFMQTLKDKGEHPDVQKHKEDIHNLLNEAIATYQSRIPVVFDAAFRADTRRLKQAVDIFLNAESAQQSAKPIGFEISFGFSDAKGELSQKKPVVLTLSNKVSLRLRGRIDRVNSTKEGYEIWDYKTGSTSSYDRANLLKGGLHLQWVLYAHALNAILKNQDNTEPVVRSGYFFTSERGGGQRFSASPATAGELANMLDPLLGLAAHGSFLHVHKHKNLCNYCDYNRICAEESCSGDDLIEQIEDCADPDLQALLARWIDG